MEPFFDLYQNQVLLAGGVPVYVPLEFQPYNEKDSGSGGAWVLQEDTLRSKVSSNTKAILLNSPHNPTGKLFTRKEMEMIASAVVECAHPDCIVLSDEVYKYIVHAPPLNDVDDTSTTVPGHIHFASLPGMWDRTLTISSAGKTFSATGGQVGWCIGPHKYIAHIQRLLPYVQFCASTVVQGALDRALVAADGPYHGYPSYYAYLRDNYTQKRDGLAAALSAAGLAVPDWDRTPGGGFFILARVSPELQARAQQDRGISMESSAMNCRPDWAVCDWLLQEHGLVCIPSKNSLLFRRECSTRRVGFAYTDRLL